MPGAINKDTHTDDADFEGPVGVDNPHAKRPLDKKRGQLQADKSVSIEDVGTVFSSGKVAEQFQQMFTAEGLSEDFTSKASVLIEGAISEQVSTIREQIEAEFEIKLQEATATSDIELVEKIDTYINYVAETFIEQNKLAIESGIKSEIAEQVMLSVTSIIESAGVTLPEDKIDVAEALATELIELEAKLNETTEHNIALTEQVKKFQISEAFELVSEGISVTGKEKLKRLAENISFGSIDEYKSKINILKESVDAKATLKTSNLNEELALPKEQAKTHQTTMDRYIAASKLI